MKGSFGPPVLTWTSLAALCLAGCGAQGPPRYTAAGTLLLNGKPLPVVTEAPPGEPAVRVELFPNAGDPSQPGDPRACDYDAATGKFTTVGPDGKGVEAGKYRVAVSHFGDDALSAKFTPEATPITVEVKAPGALEPPVIELSKY
jgi:hypothetical protein